MKKIISVILLIIIIPYIIVTLFIKEEEINFIFASNMLVRVKREKTGEIEQIPFEEYVTGVLAGEMPSSFSEEALKAQAVAARTYVLKKIKSNKNKDYDVDDTIKNQVYLDEETLKKQWGNNYEKKINKLRKIILDTKGEYLSYNNEVITAFFFSTSNGKTENSEEVFSQALPYLRSVESKWDEEVSPVYSTTKEMSLNDFYTKLDMKYSNKLVIKVLEYTTSGSVKKIKVNDKEFKGTEFRKKLNLRSTYFKIKQVNNNVVFENKGNGHGVGMSQYGAEGMAKHGYKYDQILKYYYSGVEISKI